MLYTCYKVKDETGLLKLFHPHHSKVYGHHCTIEFGKNATPVNEGETHFLEVIGGLVTDRIDCLVINPESYKGKNKHPHITLSIVEDAKPAECNISLAENAFTPCDRVMIETVLTNVR